MATARAIISNTLSFGLNRLSPGETLDADTAAVCLRALNELVDECNAGTSYLFRDILTAGTVTGATGTLGTTWPTIDSGDTILGASYNNGSSDIAIQPITLAQYQAIPVKSTSGDPLYYCHDGGPTIYFWPAPTGRSVSLLTREAVSDFADLDTVYSLPAGYTSAFSAILAEKLAPTMVGGVSQSVAQNASSGRRRLANSNVRPAIIGQVSHRFNVLRGF